MRVIDSQPPADPRWRRWIRDCERATAQLRQQVATGVAPSISNLYRRESVKNIYFFSKGPPFYGKCAYCETPITDFQYGDIDHFRPKSAITDEQDQPISLIDEDGRIIADPTGKPVPHPGYYWLAYDWTNLLPSCIRCNQAYLVGDKKIGKHARFPVAGRHAQSPDEIENEEPLLIHPGSGKPEDDPAQHLRVESETGVMVHKSDRGRMCIEVFGLNLRDQLLENRKRACDQTWYLLSRLLRPGGDADAKQEILGIKAGSKPFTMAQLAVLDEAEAIFSPVLG